MEYFRNSFKSILGSSQSQNTQNGSEIIERLVDRVKNALILEDRRDAARALKSLSKKYRIEVGAHGMDALIQILEMDRNDPEIVSYALWALYNIISYEHNSSECDADSEPSHGHCESENVAEQFCEMFLKNANNLQLVLNCLDEYDFEIRWPSIKLLSSLVDNLPKKVQELILISPTGVSKLIDLLDEKREIIRNEIVLLLIQLTLNSINIQKIVVFENVLDRLFDVIRLEGGLVTGGIVVEDCLALIYNLLRNNVSNQKFFREGGFIQKFTNFLLVANANDDNSSWTIDKIVCFNLSLKIVQTLINPSNSMQTVNSCQIVIRNCSLLQKLCDLLMAVGVPIDVLTEIINTVADIIRGNLINQQIFSQVMAPSTPPRPVLNVLLMSMVNEKQPFLLRCSILYCFECFVYKYDSGQADIINSFICNSTSTDLKDYHDVTISQVLYGGMYSNDVLSSWLSSIALAHCLLDNVTLKEKLLNVFLSTNLGSHPISILEQCTNHFQKSSSKLQVKIGLLIFLSVWLSNCTTAVKAFLNTPNTMSYLIAQISANEQYGDEELLQYLCAFLLGICIKFNDDSIAQYSKDNLYKIIEKRVGYDDYIKKLSNMSTHELFSRTIKNPYINVDKPDNLLLDYEFCKLYRTLENVIVKELKMKRDLANGLSEMTLTDEENGLLMQYKNLIRDQDDKLRNLSASLASFVEDKRDLQLKVDELEQSNAQLKDQNTYLKTLVASYSSSPENSVQNGCLNSESDENIAVNQKFLNLQEELAKLRKDHDDLLELLAEQDIELCRYRDTKNVAE